MTLFIKICAVSVCSASLATAFSMPAVATTPTADAAMPTAVASTPRVAFDGNIRNNSLAVSPDEATAVVSYSERPDVVVYDLTTGKVRGVLHGYITPATSSSHPTASPSTCATAAWALSPASTRPRCKRRL